MLPKTEIAKINLARALIMNPELLILSKPLSPQDVDKSLIMDIIVEHSNERGVAMGLGLNKDDDVKKRLRRRPRTVFMTMSGGEPRIHGAVVWKLRSKGGSGTGAPFVVEELPPSSTASSPSRVPPSEVSVSPRSPLSPARRAFLDGARLSASWLTGEIEGARRKGS